MSSRRIVCMATQSVRLHCYDYEVLTANSEAMLQISIIHLLLKRLAWEFLKQLLRGNFRLLPDASHSLW